MQHREHLEDELGDTAQTVAPCRQADQQVFLHAEQRKDLSALRDITDTQAGTLFGAYPAQIGLSILDAPVPDW